MAITCALGPKHIDALAKAIYKKMSTLPQGEVFDINGYMDYLYQNIAEKQGVDNALQYMQQFPYLANIIAAKLIDVVEIDPSVNLGAMAKAYRNPDTGWQAVNARFNTELTPEAMNALSDYEANTPTQEDYEDEIPEPITEASDDRLKASTALSGTLQQFLTKNPNDKAEDVIETPDPSKTYIKLTISKIQNIAKDLAIGSTINYQGKFLRLKVVNLASVPRDERTPETDALVGRMIGISDEETKKNDVTPLNQLFAIVLTDEAGNTIYFNQNGDVTTKQNFGKPVYQMMRDVRFQNNRFTVRDIYNKEDQIISPKDEAINTIRLMGYKSISQYEANENTTFKELVTTIDKQQQAQFKQLYDLKQQAMKGNAPLLFVTGASVGVLNEKVKQDINLSDVAAMQSDAINTFLILNAPAYGFGSGTAIITINGETFPVDRTDISKDVSEKIAQVLQSQTISNKDKILFYNQFFNDEVVNLKTDKERQDTSFVTSTRRHKLVKSKSGKPFFVYADYTLAELNANKQLVNKVNFVPLDGSQQSIDKIKEVLNGGKASVKDGNVRKFGAKLNYMNSILTSDFYDYVDGKLVKSGTYKDFLTKLNPKILISKTAGLPLYNSYIRFAIPDARSSQVNKAQERAKEDSRSAVRKFKDNMVEVIKDAEPKSIKVKVTNVIEKQYPDKRPSTYNYDVVIEGQEGTHRFYNAQSIVNLGDTYYLTVEDVTDGGFLFKDTVKARVDSKKSGALDMGSLGERDFKIEDSRGIPIETVTAAETEQAVELDELTPTPNTLPEDQVEADQEEYINPSDTTQPSDGSPVSRRFKRDYGKFKLDRSAKLSNEVTQEQVDAATTWWNNSPLSKFISLEHVANIVNSNVYARFIAAGSSLLAEQNLDGKLGKILINEATKGSMVDTYHEAWHVFSQLFLTREEKLKLYNEVRNSDPKFKNLSARAIEEVLAEDFRSYALSPKTKKGAPVRNTLFRRILNFLKKLFTGKQSLANQIQPQKISTYGVAGELFNKLYFASNNPELLNDYTPLVDNVQWDMLNRGVRQQGDYKEDALNDRDSLDLSNALDSLISEEIDNAYLYTKEHNGADANKSGSINILLKDDNKTVLYEFLKEELQDRVDAIKDKLPVKPATPFNSLNTLDKISKNAIAVIKNSKGDDEYFFLRTQIEDFDNLNLDTKKGERVKGEIYKDAEVIGDFYTHKVIKGTDKTPANIVIVNSLEEAQAQFEAYKKDTTYTEIIENPNAGTTQPDLDFTEQQDLDRLRIFQTAIRNWNNVIKFHKEHSDFNIINKKVALQESDPELNTEEADNDKNEEGGENFNSSVGDITLQQLADNEVIYMLKSLFALNKAGEYEYDRLGFKKRASFKKVWNALVRSTNSAKDPQEIYDRIVAASATYPELKQLIDYKLPNPEVEDHKNGTSFSITTSFWNAFSLPRIKYIQLLVNQDKSGTTTEVTNTSMDVSSTKRKFTSQFKAEKPNKFITKDKFNNNILNLNAIVQEFINSNGQLKSGEDAEYKFLKAIGFKYDDLGRIKQNLRDPKNRKDYSIDYLFKAVKELRDAQASGNATEEGWKIINAFKSNPIETLSKGFSAGVVGLPGSAIYIDGLKLSTAVSRLIELQNKYGATSSNFSVLNAAKKRVNEHTTDNTLTVIADALNTAENKTDLFKKGSITSYLDPRRNPWTNNLQTFNTLFDASNKKREGRSIAIEMSSGTQIAGKDGTTTTDLDPRSKFIQEFHTMLKSGIQEILRPGSKSSSFGWRIDGGIEAPGIGTKVDKHLYIDFDTFLNLNDELDAIEKIILPYVSSEVARINIFKTNPEAKNYIGYNKPGRDGKPSGEQFIYFDGILSESTKKEILSKVNTTEIDLLNYIATDPALKEKILKETQSYFEVKSKKLYNYLQEAKYVDPKLMERFNIPGFTGAQKENLLMKTYMYNSWIHNLETSVIFFGDIAQYDHPKQGFHKRTSGLISNGRRVRTDVAAIRYINEQFNANGKTYASTLPEKYNKFTYDGSLNTAVIQEIRRDSVYLDDIREGLTKFYTERTNMSADEVKKTVDREVKKYTKEEIKEGDGQGYITFDAYRTLKRLQNKWGDEQENLFQKIINGEAITEPIDEFFPAYKLQNFAFLDNTVLPVTAFHKFALFPLIPGVIKPGSDFDKMHKSMLEQNLQYLTFDSGSKVGTLTSDGEPDRAHDENGRFNESVVFTKNTFNAGFLKEVTNVPKKYKGKVVFSTQLRKLILDGLYEEGAMTMPQYSGLVKAYENSVAFNTELLKTELMEEIGYVEGKGVTQPEKFLKVIKENLRRKDYPEHLLRSLKTNRDGSLKYDLSYFLDAKTIEDTIMSIVEKKFVRQKVKGEALVQVASSFTNNMWTTPSEEDVKKYMGSNTLPFYYPGKDGKTNAMKVAIAMQGDFFKLYNLNHNDGQPIGDINRLNDMIKNDQWLDTDGNRKAITMTAVRIPVQGLNSMEFMEVYEFLNPSAGSHIFVPTELVAKSGGDFDVDKLTTFMPNLDDTGKVITSDMSKEQFFSAYAKASDSDKKQMMKLQKKAVENSFIENIRGILEIPENFASLVRPNDTTLLEELSKKLEDKVSDFDKYEKVNGESTNLDGKGKKMISPTTVLEQRYNVAKHGHNIIGKAVLGIGASENAMNPVFNQAGVILPKKYKASKYDPDLGKYVEFGEPIYDMRLFMPHNKTKSGNISLSNIYDVGGVDRIADLFSQGINGWVDVEANEWIFYIQGNYELAPTMLYLFKSGVPREYAVKFVSSPFIREYAEQLRKIQGPFAKSMGIAAKEKPFERYEATKKVIERHMLEYLNASTSMLQANDQITAYFKERTKRGWEDVPYQMTYGELQNNINNSTYDLNAISSIDINLPGIQRTLYVKPSADNATYYNSTSKANEQYENGYSLELMDNLINKKPSEFNANETMAAMGMLLHFNEIQKQIQGVGRMKRRGKPDTTLFRNIQEIILRDLDIESLDNDSKVDKVSKDKIFNESITSSLGDKKIIVDVVSQMLVLRNADQTTNYIQGLLTNAKNKGLIGEKFGKTNDGMVNFVDAFKNNISNFILQNYLSNFIDAKGNIVKIPQEFNEMPVKLSKNLSTDVEIKDGVVYVNSQNLREDFSNKSYLDTAQGPRSYAQRPGLEPFKIEQDPFASEEAYIKYAMIRASLQAQGITGAELNKTALLEAFNYNALMRNNDYSYTNEVIDVIQKYPKLIIDFPILEQISILSTSAFTDFNVLTLTDRDAIDGKTKDVYANNIRALGNPRIQKVADPKENQRISNLFQMLPLVAVYQHGVGSTLYGFDQVLPQDMIQSTMQNASNLFKLNYWNDKGLSHVFNSTVNKDEKQFKNFVLTEDELGTEAPIRATFAEVDPFEEMDNEPFFASQLQTTPTLTSYTNHSGGAQGSDSEWDIIGKEFGMINNKHYYTGEKGPKNAPLGNIDITNEPIAVEGANKVAQAAKEMWGYKYNTMKDQRLIRNWAQVANSDAVFAIGKLGEEGDIWKGDEKSAEPRRLLKVAVQGGTGYAVEMAIQAGKPVYVFDLTYNVWMKYNPEGSIDSDIPGAKGRFEQVDTPVLTKNFAGIGTREINEAGKQAIKDVYAKTLAETPTSNITTQPTVSTVKPDSIKNVKEMYLRELGTFTFTVGQDEYMASPKKNDAGEVKFVLSKYDNNTKLFKAVRNPKTQRTLSTQEVTDFLNENLPKDFIDFAVNLYENKKDKLGSIPSKLSPGKITNATSDIWSAYLFQTPLREMIYSSAESPIILTLDEVNKAFNELYSDELKAGVEKYLKPFIKNELIKEINVQKAQLKDSIEKYNDPVTIAKSEIYINDLEKALENFNQTFTQPTATQTPIRAKTTDQYRYFGSMYTIKLQDGIGIDVEGYKGKADAKAKLLNAYNTDPNIDPQNGRAFRETPTQLDVESQNSADTFVFADGISISVPFQLNSEQQAALYKLENFYNNPGAYDNEITLSGYAGTGKTTILGIFDKYLKEKSYVKPIYTSPTHRANAVTKMKNPKAKVKTLHSLFGLNPMLNLEGDQLDVRDVKTESFRKPELGRRDVIIVDESSMVTNELYDLIQQFKKELDLRIIFAGDKGQLGPVQDDTKLESKVFDDPKNQAQLTKVERTGDNPILLNSTRAREGQDFTYVTEEINGNGVEFLDTPDRLNQVMGQNLKEMQQSGNMLYFRILSSLNKDVARINLQARDIMFGAEAKKTPYIKGDILMGYDNIGDDLINSGDYVVESVSELTDITVKVPIANLSSGYLNFGKPKEVSLKGYKVILKDILNPDNLFTISLPAEGNDEALAEIAKGLLELKSYYPRVQGRDRGSLFSEISGVSKQIVFNKDIKENGRFLAKKGIDYGYAHTIHKSQGGTYNKVLIFDDSISSLAAAIADKRKLGMNGQKSIKDQLKYVAISRASEYAYVYNSKDTAVGGFDFRGEAPANITEADMDTAAVASFSFATEQTPTPQVQTKGEVAMRSDNVTKIFSGNKTITNRTYFINDGKYTVKGSNDVIEFTYLGKATLNGNTVTIVNEKTGIISTRTFDQFSKAEGFKDGADFRANDRFSKQFLAGLQSRYIYKTTPVSALSADAEAGLGKIPETNTDIQDFKDAVAKNNNIFPNKLVTSAGRLYVLNSDGLYNLVDSLSGTVLMKNIDLTTGEVGLPSNVNVPATNAYKTELLNQIQVLKQQYQLEELLGQYGYDIKDLIDTIQNATTKDQVDDVASLINEKICK